MYRVQRATNKENLEVLASALAGLQELEGSRETVRVDTPHCSRASGQQLPWKWERRMANQFWDYRPAGDPPLVCVEAMGGEAKPNVSDARRHYPADLRGHRGNYYSARARLIA